MNDLLPLARRLYPLIRAAGGAILKIYHGEDFGIEIKADESPLTRADRAANDIIVAGLRDLPTVYPIVSEENKQIPYAERKDFHRFWLVDPLDGTKEFIKRNGDFTVNIALIQAGTPILGLVYVPVTDELFVGTRGGGAFLVGPAGREVPLRAAAFALTDPGLRVLASRSHLSPETEAYLGGLNRPETVSRGSSLKFIELARGAAHLYPRLAPTMEWDTGAAHVILREAGGSVIDQESGEPLRYNKEVLRNPHFIAYGALKS